MADGDLQLISPLPLPSSLEARCLLRFIVMNLIYPLDTWSFWTWKMKN